MLNLPTTGHLWLIHKNVYSLFMPCPDITSDVLWAGCVSPPQKIWNVICALCAFFVKNTLVNEYGYSCCMHAIWLVTSLVQRYQEACIFHQHQQYRADFMYSYIGFWYLWLYNLFTLSAQFNDILLYTSYNNCSWNKIKTNILNRAVQKRAQK